MACGKVLAEFAPRLGEVRLRLPVRIALDPKELAEHPLRVGESTDVTIDLSGH